LQSREAIKFPNGYERGLQNASLLREVRQIKLSITVATRIINDWSEAQGVNRVYGLIDWRVNNE
jgi:hypothetical protein